MLFQKSGEKINITLFGGGLVDVVTKVRILKEYIDKCEDNAKKMIKEQNGYEKYSEWFKIIKNVCQRGDAIKADDDDNHYILSDNMHVYINTRGGCVISEGELQDLDSRYEMKARYCGWIEGTDRDRIYMSCGNNSAAMIVYGAEGIQIMGPGTGKDYLYLPLTSDDEKSNIVQQQKTGDFHTDMRNLLSEALDKAEDDETKKMYEDTIKFYDKIEKIIELEKQKMNEQKNESISVSNNIPEISDSDELEEMSTMSTEDLEEKLKSIKASNNSKREELESLRKKQLISQIRDAIKEGRDLDSKIAEAKENTIENL